MCMDWWIERYQKVKEDRLGEMLGIFWDQDKLEELFKEPNLEELRNQPRQQSFFWPLTLAIRPEFIEVLRKSTGRKYGIGAPDWISKDEDFVDIFNWEPDDFMQFVGSVVSHR